MDKISWTDDVKNQVVLLLRVKEERNVLHVMKGRMANSIGHNLRRNCLLTLVIERMLQLTIGVTGRQ